MSQNNINNVVYHQALVKREKREKLNNHKSKIIWFTGLSGSGKSTLSHAVEEEFHNMGLRTYVLDGDNIRLGLSSDLTFSDIDRRENIRRIGETAKLMIEAGIIVMTAFISPFKKDRNLVRQLVDKNDFIEIFCKASIETCELRDVKGMYKKARLGLIKDFTGISSPYEKPENPELIIDTEKFTIKESIEIILNHLQPKILL
jgi:adenylylsulfate kinase